jgi:D-beta-D-heptose 7-phosphate kinase/D-beta-D-heptose 1-phosphate adenosyltransferase
MFDFEDAIKRFSQQTVLCVGDLMLDDFVYGDVARISPEAPTPVLAVTKSELMIGGAGNVARNIASLGARCILVAVVGDDEAAHVLASRLGNEALIAAHLVKDPSRPTTRKVRFVSEQHSSHLLRADWEVTNWIEGATEAEVLQQALSALPDAQTLVLSDYAKGTLTPKVAP